MDAFCENEAISRNTDFINLKPRKIKKSCSGNESKICKNKLYFDNLNKTDKYVRKFFFMLFYKVCRVSSSKNNNLVSSPSSRTQVAKLTKS